MKERQVDLGIPGLDEPVLVGRGGSSRVYRAWQSEFHRWVAAKVITDTGDVGILRRFERERRALGSLSGHDGIVAVHQSGTTRHGDPYLLMPFYEQGSLEDVMVERGPVPWRDATGWMGQVARTLADAHAHGVLHRDIKPANVLRTNVGRLVIADFGLARVGFDAGASRSTTVVLTPAYSPPEAFERHDPTPAVDVYSLGATWWALLAGRAPFVEVGEEPTLFTLLRRIADEPVGDLRAQAPDRVCDVIEWAMHKNPDDRPESMAVLADRIDDVLADPECAGWVAPERPTETRALVGPVAGAAMVGAAGAAALADSDDDSAAAVDSPGDLTSDVDTGAADVRAAPGALVATTRGVRRRSSVIASGAAAAALVVLVLVLASGGGDGRGDGDGNDDAVLSSGSDTTTPTTQAVTPDGGRSSGSPNAPTTARTAQPIIGSGRLATTTRPGTSATTGPGGATAPATGPASGPRTAITTDSRVLGTQVTAGPDPDDPATTSRPPATTRPNPTSSPSPTSPPDPTSPPIPTTTPNPTTQPIPTITPNPTPTATPVHVAIAGPQGQPTGTTTATVTFSTNVCAVAEYVARADNGTDTNRHATPGYPGGECVTSHRAELGTWTKALKPGTAYTVSIHVIADNGTTDDAVATFTTGAPAPVTIHGTSAAATGSTTAVVTFSTNVCAVAEYVARADNGTDTNRHATPGYPGGECVTSHRAELGTWTKALRPGTAYSVAVNVISEHGTTASATVTFTTPG